MEKLVREERAGVLMWVNKLWVQDYRKFVGKHDIKLHFRLNIFVGINGSGKSSLTDALASLLSGVPFFLEGENFSLGDDKPSNIAAGKRATLWGFNLTYGKATKGWSLQVSRTPADWIEAEEIDPNQLGFLSTLAKNKDNPATILPFIGFLHSSSTRNPTSYLDLQPTQHSRLIAYRGAFDSESAQFEEMEAWFEQEENLENQQRIEQSDLSMELPTLKAVRNAVKTFLIALQGTQLGRLRIIRAHSIDPLKPARGQLAISKGTDLLLINQLSDGERRLILMIADTARRMVVLNPTMPQPLDTPGILMVDEIDLHLHPTWQRTVVPALLKTFTNLQFILTTHSPQVLSSVKDENVLLIKDGKIYPGGMRVSGRDTNSILVDEMGTTARPDEVEKALQELFAWIEPHPRKAKKRLKELEAQLGQDDHELVRARAMMEFLGI